MRSLFYLLVCCLIVCKCVEGATPERPVWPDEFKLPFGLNDPLLFVKNSSAVMYYNWDQVQSQLLDYSQSCFPLVRWNARSHPCKMYFNPKGIFVSFPTLNITCCSYVPGVGAVPPDFLRGFNYSGHIESVPDQHGIKHNTYRWDGADDFKYWTDANNGDDVQFQDGPTGVKWNFGDMVVEAQATSIFDLPAGDCSQDCNFFAADVVEYQEARKYSPLLNLALNYHGKL